MVYFFGTVHQGHSRPPPISMGAVFIGYHFIHKEAFTLTLPSLLTSTIKSCSTPLSNFKVEFASLRGKN